VELFLKIPPATWMEVRDEAGNNFTLMK